MIKKNSIICFKMKGFYAHLNNLFDGSKSSLVVKN